MRKFKGNNTSRVYTEIFSDEKGSLLESESGARGFYTHEWIRDYLTEIKEPVKLTIWKNLWQRKDGSYFFGCDWYDEQSAKRDACDMLVSIKFIKTVKVEEEVEQ